MSQSSRVIAALTVLLDADGLTVGGGLAVVASPQPVHAVPDGVAVQQRPLFGIAAPGDGGRDRLLEAGQVLVAGRQRAGGDQDAAQVPERFAVGQFVESGVRQCSLADGEFAHDHRRGVLVQPGQHGLGSFVVGEVVVQRAQSWVDRAGVLAQQFLQPLPQRAAGAPPRALAGWVRRSPGRRARRTGRVGAGRAERRGERPAAGQPDLPQPVHRPGVAGRRGTTVAR